MSKVDEVRNLYERQVEVYKEDMKRVDLKAEQMLREVEKANFKQDLRMRQIENNLMRQVTDAITGLQVFKDYQVKNEEYHTSTDYYLHKILPIK